MAFDYSGAISVGYTPDEIATELKNRGVEMDVSAALKAGYSDDEIAKEIDNRFNSKSSVPSRPADYVEYQEEPKPKEQLKEEGIIDKIGHFVQMPSQALQEALSRNPSDTASDVVKGAAQSNLVNNAFYAGGLVPAGNIATNIYNQATDSNAQNPVQTYREDQQQQARAIEQEAIKNGQPSASYELGNMIGDYNNLAFGAGGAGEKIAAENLVKEYGRKAVEGGVIGSGFGAGKSVGMDEPLNTKDILEGGATLAILNPLLHGITQSYSRGLKIADGMGLKGNEAIDFATRTAQDEAIAKTFNEQTKSIADTIDKKLVDMGEKPQFKTEEVKPILDADELNIAKDISKENNIPIEEATKIVEEAKNTNTNEIDKSLNKQELLKENTLPLEEPTSKGVSVDEAQEQTKKTLGKQFDNLKDDINIVQKYEDLPQDLQDRGEQFSSGGKVRGVFDPQDGKVHLIADSMDAKEVPSVVVHELLHKSIANGSKPLGEAHDTFVLRLKQLKDEPLVKEAFQSVKDAGTLDKHVNEEMMSYLVEKYQAGKDMSPRLKHFISDVIDKVKVFASETAVKLGVDAKWLVSKMNEKDIASLLKASAIKYSLKSGTKKDVMFSKAKETIKEIPNSDQSKPVQEAIKKALNKNMIEGTLDKGIQKIVGGAMKLADAVTAHKITKAYDKVMDTQFMDNMFGHKIYKAMDYMELRDTTLQNMNKSMSKAMDMHNQLKDLSMQAREAMYDYATGDKSVQLTPELKKATDTMINMVDAAGKKLVENGTLSKEAYEEWQGQYLHRKYISKLKNAQDILYKSGGGFKTEEIKARGKIWEATKDDLKTLEDNGEIGKVSEGKIEATELPNGKISLRRDWTKEERAKMGEIRDIAFAFPETYGRLAMLAEHGKLLASIPEKYIAKEGKFTDSQLKDFGYKKLDGKKFGALNGRWVSNTIADDIHRTATELNGDETMKAYKEYVSMLKASHTIYNTSSHVNNLLSNVVMQFTAGLNPAKAIVYAVQGARTLKDATRLQELNAKELTGLSHNETKEIAKLKADKNVSLMVEAQELGLFGRSQLNSILRTYLSPSVDVGASGKLAKVKEGFTKAYEGEDNMMRFSAFKQLREQGMSAKEAVTKINNDIVPDYSKPMSKYARVLRDSGFVPFMSWIYYSTPMIVRQLKQSPSRTIALMAGIYAIDNAFGINPYDAKDMPQDGFAKDNMVTGRNGNKVDVARISSILPQSQLLSPVDTVKGMLTGGIPQTAVAALFNMDLYNNRPVTQAKGGKAVYQYSKNLIQNVLPTPDVADRAYNLAESHILPARVRKSNEVIEPRTPTQEALSFLVNTKTYDKSKQREKAINDKLKDEK